MARRAVEIGSDKQAENIVLLDARQACNFTDYMVILTAESDRQVNAIRDEVVHSLKQDDVYPRHVEGDASSGWILIDYIDAVVHIFAPAEREFYQLDSVWPEASPVVHIQ
ncbi:MAG: ribosome silencing factor [Dehalococcoidales bacterium]|nr:ribosome silencing factor [Dehalococcoidales bacterium]MDD3265103.1 ribosome silencing factor [Dehalococcoidales bacterium]MDD4322604.1 ribosome silencing factor [Dehalococcoidales bacterium]MDD4794156.1 ribosome silencing factor [Dehalococcoidales bacterium]MDD5122493.1 ribosome silencing factor [Dehalococcoidales bacterium]